MRKTRAYVRYAWLMMLDLGMYLLTFIFLPIAYKNREEIYKQLYNKELSGWFKWLWYFLNDSGSGKDTNGVPFNCPKWFADYKGLQKESKEAFFAWHKRNRNYNWKNVKLVINTRNQDITNMSVSSYNAIDPKYLKVTMLENTMANTSPYVLPSIPDNGDLTNVVPGKKVMLVEYWGKTYLSYHHVFKSKKGIWKRRVYGLDMELNKNISMFIRRNYKG